MAMVQVGNNGFIELIDVLGSDLSVVNAARVSMGKRHDELSQEMVKRGYQHNSPYQQPDLSHYNLSGFVVDRRVALEDLYSRCSECKRS